MIIFWRKESSILNAYQILTNVYVLLLNSPYITKKLSSLFSVESLRLRMFSYCPMPLGITLFGPCQLIAITAHMARDYPLVTDVAGFSLGNESKCPSRDIHSISFPFARSIGFLIFFLSFYLREYQSVQIYY
jgi:hypothetical protein